MRPDSRASGGDRDAATVIGILYPGEMGAALGAALAAPGAEAPDARPHGLRVVTTLEGRGPATQRRWRELGLQPVASLRDVVQAADVVVSLVPPAAAMELAQHYCAVAPAGPAHQVYVDANSIAPASIAAIEKLVTGAGRRFVDASILGPASRLTRDATVYLSGAAAAEIEALLPPTIRVRVLGPVAGRASALKMIMAGMNKGLAALFIEMGLVASEMDLLDEFYAGYSESYPGIMSIVDRMIPSYPRHARRRADEMAELEQTVLALGLCPHLTRGAHSLIAAVGALDWQEQSREEGAPELDTRQVIAALYRRNPLRGEDQPATPPNTA